MGSAEMIILDTHIWVWWVHGERGLTDSQRVVIEANEARVIGVSAISVWEVAKLVEYNRLVLPCGLHEWFDSALCYPGIRLIELSLKSQYKPPDCRANSTGTRPIRL